MSLVSWPWRYSAASLPLISSFARPPRSTSPHSSRSCRYWASSSTVVASAIGTDSRIVRPRSGLDCAKFDFDESKPGPRMSRISRRKLLGAAATVPAAAGLNSLVGRSGIGGEPARAETNGHDPAAAGHTGSHDAFAHAAFAPDRSVDHRSNGFNPTELLRDFDWGKTRRTASGKVVREWEIVAVDKEIEVAPGVNYEA